MGWNDHEPYFTMIQNGIEEYAEELLESGRFNSYAAAMKYAEMNYDYDDVLSGFDNFIEY